MTPITVRLLSSLAGRPSKDWFSFQLSEPLFDDDPQALGMYEYMRDFAKAHGKTPTRETLQEALKCVVPMENADTPFLLKEAQKRRVKRRLGVVSTELVDIAKTDPIKALSVFHEETSALIAELTTPKMANLVDAADEFWPYLIQKWTGQIKTVPLYWPKLHGMTGGIMGGEIVSTVGRPGLGKSWSQLVLALHIWREMKEPVIFFSMEMMLRKVIERLVALYTETPADFFKFGYVQTAFGGVDPKSKIKDALFGLQASGLPPFLIVDANLTATVEDVGSLCHRVKPAAVFVDGAYMLRVPGKRALRGFEKIEEVCYALKRDIATSLDVPTFCSWQFNREAAKIKPGAIPQLDQIAGGDAIGQISSLVLAMVDESVGDGNPVDAGRRRFQIIKGRDGETGGLLTRWNFQTMRFDQVKDPTDKSTEYDNDEYETQGLYGIDV